MLIPTAAARAMVVNPIRLPGATLPARAAPAFGADTDSLLEELNYDAARIAELKRNDVVK
jgi:crotonobetainyl-CoA:carnitine CoA-transferase CaiB-like acyl-CoA transferase